VVDHQHNHCAKCWWEIRATSDPTRPSAPGELSGKDDVRLHADWKQPVPLDTYHRANDPDDKTP
ncbi:MAG: hypothetical protein ABIP20_01165, partial [Chthoniobacteraceae bacterium]